jgi:hypothetical protein
MDGAGRKGKLPPVVERALSWYAGHGGDGSGIARRREGFWFRDQKSEVSEEALNGQSPITQDPAKGKERRAERPITSSARRVNGDR